jgi:hypothetical protein
MERRNEDRVLYIYIGAIASSCIGVWLNEEGLINQLTVAFVLCSTVECCGRWGERVGKRDEWGSVWLSNVLSLVFVCFVLILNIVVGIGHCCLSFRPQMNRKDPLFLCLLLCWSSTINKRKGESLISLFFFVVVFILNDKRHTQTIW